jgi:predicted AAA+ superfamily ATPase
MRKLFKREKYLSKIIGFYFENDLIKVITGIRRCGKSSLMEMISYELIEKGVDKNNIIYINLDKRGYKNIKTDIQLENLIDEKTKDIDGDKYLLIDEIQNVKDFEPVINAFREEGDYSIFITGSNSYLLSGELMNKLTGRYLEFELYQLTFDE